MANGLGAGRAATSIGQMLMQKALYDQQRQDREAERKDIADLRREQAITSRLGTALAPGDTFLPYSPGMGAPPEGAQPLNVMGESGFRVPKPAAPVEPKLPPTLETSSGIFTRGQEGLEPVMDPVTQKPAMPYRAPSQAATAEPNWQTVQTDEGYVQVNPKTGDTRPLGIQPKTPTARRLPPTVLSNITSNRRQIGVLDEALGLLEQRPEGVGLKGMLPDFVLSRTDPEGVALRAAVADIGSMEIRDRSGAAVTAAEFPRLAPFIPSASDPPDAVRTKLRRMRDIIADEAAQYEAGMQEYYGVGSGEGTTPQAAGPTSAPVPAPAAATTGSWQARASELKAQGLSPDAVIAQLRSEGLIR